MLISTELPRVFTLKEGKETITLPDPDSSWLPKRVLNFYAPTYPILTTATVTGPTLKDDKVLFEFQTHIGTKG